MLAAIGLVIIGSLDESYIHAQHHSDYSYLLIDDKGKTKREVYCAVRDGLRMCMQGLLTK
jgi:hypothetical protein